MHEINKNWLPAYKKGLANLTTVSCLIPLWQHAPCSYSTDDGEAATTLTNCYSSCMLPLTHYALSTTGSIVLILAIYMDWHVQ